MIVAPQVRAARALLGWTQDDLASRSEITHRTLAMFEVGKRMPHARTLAKIKEVLEGAGITFLKSDSALGVTVEAARIRGDD